MTTTLEQPFVWAIQRLAQMQGGTVDTLQLHAAVSLLKTVASPLQTLRAVCKQLGVKAPKPQKVVDRAHLPLLCHSDEWGWGVVADQNPLGQWVVLTQTGQKLASKDELLHRTFQLYLGVEMGIGLGIFSKASDELTFFSNVQQTLLLYRRELIEACIASAFIGFLALATSLFSMQVYDRVIPTRSEYTLMILSAGVLISIFVELAMKFARSHIMDYVVVGLDGKLSREIFQRLLQLRVDQMPASVGSLAGQLRGYEQVRGFYTASTLFTLIDLPLALLFIVVIMLVASPWVAVVPLLFGALALWVGLSIRRKIMVQAKAGAALSNMKTGLLVEAVEGIETIMAIPGLLVQHAHAQAALEGLEKLYHLKTDHHGVNTPLVPSNLRGHFALEDVKFAYGDNPPAVVVPKLEIQTGERIAVLGPIGAGKSTLLRLLSGLYHPQAGRVLLDHLNLAHISRQVVSQHVGYLQQDHRLFQGTLRENLLIGMTDPGDESLMDAMKQTGMDKFVASHPKGLDRVISEGGKGLSGGQKQLVAFTRLILCNPNVLLLDEPTATMDDEQERRCLAVLAQQAQMGKGMVIVTHKPSVLPLVTRLIVMVGHSIVLDGPRDDVLQKLKQPVI
jgi:ABC-type bacteriocin/lantibiotic exporter with double-glycine peptidase domain